MEPIKDKFMTAYFYVLHRIGKMKKHIRNNSLSHSINMKYRCEDDRKDAHIFHGFYEFCVDESHDYHFSLHITYDLLHNTQKYGLCFDYNPFDHPINSLKEFKKLLLMNYDELYKYYETL